MTRTVAATSVGCGLLCEVTVHLERGSVRVDGGCPHAAPWFGDGVVPDRILVNGTPATFEEALHAAGTLLVGAHGNVVACLAPGLSIEAMRPVVAMADALGADVETATSRAAAQAIVAGQRRGRAAATLGELANRADVVLLWGVDARRLACVQARILDRAGTHLAGGRRDRRVIAVQVGTDGTLAGADVAGALAPADELQALSLLRAAAQGRPVAPPAHLAFLAEVAHQLVGARYAGIIAPAEDGDPARAPERGESLVALAQALNGPTRAALLTLRDGGNRNGAEALLTWQAGYPLGVSYRNGTPTSRPGPGRAEALASAGAVLLAGDWRAMPTMVAQPRTVVAIGPRASEAAGVHVAIDTGVLGVHEGGTVYRADDVPLAVAAVLDGARTAAMTCAALGQVVERMLRSAAA